jgi:hypothetical protein
MWLFPCCASRKTRFRSIAGPVIRDLKEKKKIVEQEGNRHANESVQQKRDAVRFFNENEMFRAQIKAVEAIRTEEMAQRYFTIYKIVDDKLRQVETLWSHHDLIDNMDSTASQLQQLGVIQRAEQEGDDEIPSLETRIDSSNKMLSDFTSLVQRMEDEIQRVPINASQNVDDVLKKVQLWSMGKVQPVINRDKNLSPDALAMLSSSSDEEITPSHP